MKRLLHMLQTATGATAGEVTVAMLLLIGAILGNLLQRLEAGAQSPAIASPDQIRVLLAPHHQATHPDLAHATNVRRQDTVVTAVNVRTAVARRHEQQQILVNLNTASKTRLMTIPGVGEATADRILQYRSNVQFTRPEDLKNIKGIGEKRFERMRPFITAP